MGDNEIHDLWAKLKEGLDAECLGYLIQHEFEADDMPTAELREAWAAAKRAVAKVEEILEDLT